MGTMMTAEEHLEAARQHMQDLCGPTYQALKHLAAAVAQVVADRVPTEGLVAEVMRRVGVELQAAEEKVREEVRGVVAQCQHDEQLLDDVRGRIMSLPDQPHACADARQAGEPSITLTTVAARQQELAESDQFFGGNAPAESFVIADCRCGRRHAFNGLLQKDRATLTAALMPYADAEDRTRVADLVGAAVRRDSGDDAGEYVGKVVRVEWLEWTSGRRGVRMHLDLGAPEPPGDKFEVGQVVVQAGHSDRKMEIMEIRYGHALCRWAGADPAWPPHEQWFGTWDLRPAP